MTRAHELALRFSHIARWHFGEYELGFPREITNVLLDSCHANLDVSASLVTHLNASQTSP